MRRRQITGMVRGVVQFPEHPEHQGSWGLMGGEDIRGARTTFRSIGEAMTWCDKILAGEAHPLTVVPAGEMLEPRTEPQWSEGYVHILVGDSTHEFISYGKGEWRRQLADGNLGDVVRVDLTHENKE